MAYARRCVPRPLLLLLLLLLLAACPALAAVRVLSAVHHAEAAGLFMSALELTQLQQRGSDGTGEDVTDSRAVILAAIDGLLHTGTVLAQAGHDEAAMDALDAVLAATASPSTGGRLSQEHMVAMVQKLSVLRRRFALLAAEAPPDENALGVARWEPQLYWLDWVPQWESRRGAVQRATGCTAPLADHALQHLEQLSIDLDVRRIHGCYVGFHGSVLRRGSSGVLHEAGMHLLQLPSVPDSTAPLLTAWALGLLPPDFKPRGTSWPFELPLAPGVVPEDFSGASVVQRAARYIQRLQLDGTAADGRVWPGFAALNREELEARLLWQSADELRHYEGLGAASAGGAEPCSGRPEVVRVGRLVSVIGGYALNYFHWVTEILPGLIRLRPLITADSSVRVLTHASVEWSRGILVDVLGIAEEQLLFDHGCSVYEAEVLYTWSADNPLSPQLLEQSRQLLLGSVVEEPPEAGAVLPRCHCCTTTLRREAATAASMAPAKRRALLLDRRCAADRPKRRGDGSDDTDATVAGHGDGSRTGESQCSSSIRGRAILNHEEVLQGVAEELPAEWETCSLAALECSVPEQLACFASAELALGVEGAGLTNAMVMPRGGVVVNLHPAHPDAGFSTLVSACGQSYFWQLAQACGLDYHAFMMPEFTFSNPGRVDVEELRKFLAAHANGNE